MVGLLERNYKATWLGSIAAMAYVMLTNNQGERFKSSHGHNPKTPEMTVIYRIPFCPIARVFNTDLRNLTSDDYWENLPNIVKHIPHAQKRWVLMSPFGNHLIVHVNAKGETLKGYYSRVFETPIFPFSRI